jgi:alanine racemase
VNPCEIFLSRKALRSNFEAIQKSSGGLALFPVIKANGYGHGASLMARCLEEDFDSTKLPLFCVAQTQEALELRKAGIKREILILSSFEKADFNLGAENNFSFVISSARDLIWVLDQTSSVQKRLNLHLKFNTGMNRLGFSELEAEDLLSHEGLLERLLKTPATVSGLMSHLARSEEDPKLLSESQAAAFLVFVERTKILLAKSHRDPIRWVHLANSASLSRGLMKGIANSGRPGLRLLGSFQDGEDLESHRKESLLYQPILSLVAPIRKIFEVPKGFGIGYGHRFSTNRKSLIATLGIGYADGLRRRCGTQSKSQSVKSVSILGFRVPMVGTISMDMIGVDLTDHPKLSEIMADISSDKPVTGTWIGEGLRIEEISDALETISYEIFCGLNRRIKRSIVE